MTDRPEEMHTRPYSEISIGQETALSWYLDSDTTRLVAAGARILDRYSRDAEQISEAMYQDRINQTDDEIRTYRDSHR